MKKYIIFIASAVLMMAACAKEEINTTITGETEFISVELSPVTKTQLNVNGKVTDWTPGDEVSVTVGGKNLGSLKLVDGNVFQGEIEAGHDGEATINYPAGVTTVPPTQSAVAGSFAEKAALLEGTTTLDELRKGNGPELQNKTALLQFSVAQAGDVTFEVGTEKYTVTGCKTGETYDACVEPATAKLVARIGGYLSNATTANKTFTAGKIANLGALPAPVASNVMLRGAITGGDNWNTDITLYNDLNGLALRKDVSGKDKEFKFVNNGAWLGGPFAVKDKWCIALDWDNLKLPMDNCDVYFDTKTSFFSFVSSGSPAPAVQYIYLKPNNDWKSDSARFAVAFLNSGKNVTYWYSMVYNKDNDVYECIVPGGFTYMIFCRMNGSKLDNNWDNKWNQTGDLTIPASNGNNYFTITSWGGGSWSKKTISR